MNSPEKSDEQRIEKLTSLLAASRLENSALVEELSLARRELVAASPLLLSFGEQTWRRILNARSIRGMGLDQESTPYGSENGGKVILKEAWRVQVDEVMVTPYLPAQEAMAALAEAEARWATAITPTEK